MKTYTRPVNFLQRKTAYVAELPNRNSSVTICKLNDRTSRFRYIVYESQSLESKTPFDLIPIIAELTFEKSSILYSRKSEQYKDYLRALDKKIKQQICLDLKLH